MRSRFLAFVVGVLVAALGGAMAWGDEPPADFPQFQVPGKSREMDSLRRLFWLHYKPAGPLIPLWDEWMAKSTLWPARGDGEASADMRRRWARALTSRIMNEEGYVHTQQHDGLAHAEGWPFPFWSHAGGIGWHFAGTGVAGYDWALVGPEGWQLARAESKGVGNLGWTVALTGESAELESPVFSIDAARSPWLRLNWRSTEPRPTKVLVQWRSSEHPEFSQERQMEIELDRMLTTGNVSLENAPERRTMIPLYRSPAWRGEIRGLRLRFENQGGGTIAIKSVHTAPDTRHNINNLNFIRACHDYFMWTGDSEFLKSQAGRIRRAMAFVEREFQTRQRKCVYTTWPGHEGRSGVRWIEGQKQIVPGEGIGSNYWDLLPFGGEDALATIYYYDALGDLADLERAIAAHPEWKISADEAYDPVDLEKHADEVRQFGNARFWNEANGRFGTLDLDGNLYDYGFTFLNTEAVCYGFAMPDHAKSIHQWLSGARTVMGDTSTGADIYQWRFGPRSTTRRNVDYYVWSWSAPESVPWGYQVQDGGAVLGWSFHDLMMRLAVGGPDDAAARLYEILSWFEETQAEGGYRAYYEKDRSRGTLQGGNIAGGLGLDREFFESVLVPQVMLYGFLGFRLTVDGFAIDPRLPSDWPALTITRIHLHDHVLEITAERSGEIHIRAAQPSEREVVVSAPTGARVTAENIPHMEVVER